MSQYNEKNDIKYTADFYCAVKRGFVYLNAEDVHFLNVGEAAEKNLSWFSIIINSNPNYHHAA